MSDDDLGFGDLLLQQLGLSLLLLLYLVLTPYGLFEAKRWKFIVILVDTASIIEIVNDLCVVILSAELQLIRVCVDTSYVFSLVRLTVDFGTLKTTFEIWFRIISVIGGRSSSDLLPTSLNLVPQELVDLSLVSGISSLWYLYLQRLLKMRSC